MPNIEIITRKINTIQNCLQRITEKVQKNSQWTEDFDSRDGVFYLKRDSPAVRYTLTC